MRSRGFIALPLGAYAAIGAAVVIAGLGIAVKVQTSRLEAVKTEYAGFVAQVKALGDAQNAKAAAEDKVNKERKEKADAENKKLRSDLAGLYDAYGRLREQRARGGELPSAPAGSRRPDLACFDRAELARAMGGLEEGVLRLTRQGDEARLDLDTAKEWARK